MVRFVLADVDPERYNNSQIFNLSHLNQYSKDCLFKYVFYYLFYDLIIKC